jgi:hypothetical protein
LYEGVVHGFFVLLVLGNRQQSKRPEHGSRATYPDSRREE